MDELFAGFKDGFTDLRVTIIAVGIALGIVLSLARRRMRP
jgi:hypothetical protein